MTKQGTLFIISGTSQVGKSTVARALQHDRRLRIVNIKTNTTRPPRPEDRRSKQYHFRSVKEFKQLIKDGKFLEWARVHGYYYGTLRAEVMKALERGKNVTLVIDVQGARQVKKLMPQVISIFITAESKEELKRRIMESSHIPTQQKLSRWRSALKELKEMKHYDYIVINRWNHLKETIKEVTRIIKKYNKT